MLTKIANACFKLIEKFILMKHFVRNNILIRQSETLLIDRLQLNASKPLFRHLIRKTRIR